MHCMYFINAANEYLNYIKLVPNIMQSIADAYGYGEEEKTGFSLVKC